MSTMASADRRSQAAFAALGVALLTGIGADLLLRTAGRPGLNLPVLSMGFLLLLGVLHRRYHTSIPGASFALLFCTGFLLCSFAWRDSPTLNGLAFISAVLAAGLAAWSAQGATWQSTTMQYGWGVLRSARSALIGVLPLAVVEADWSPLRSSLGGNRVTRVGRGLVLAIPPVVIFGALFAAADPIFNAFYSRVFSFNPETLIAHVVIIGGVFWVVGGFLRPVLVPGLYPSNTSPVVSGGLLSFTETIVVVGAVSLTFLLFVTIQIRALFGGDEFVLAETGLTYAEYARQGFFHLTWAAALVLPLLLFLDWIGRRDTRREERSFRLLSALLLCLLGLVLVSAVHRMRLYQASYGLTEPRVYTVAFMAWLAPVLAWFGFTVLAGRRDRFMPGVLTLGFLAVLVLHLINPDDLIMRANLERAGRGEGFDVNHAVLLSDDAMPSLAEALPALPLADQCEVNDRVFRIPEQGDWRSWNWSRSRVDALHGRMQATIARLNAACPKST